jgi:hypothetical protein
VMSHAFEPMTPSLPRRWSTSATPMRALGIPLLISDLSRGMERLWSLAGATGGNRSQMRTRRKRLKQADRQPVATHGNRFGAHGKEGVDGSSPSEGSAKVPHVAAFAFSSTWSASNVRWVWSRLWSFRAREAGRERQTRSQERPVQRILVTGMSGPASVVVRDPIPEMGALSDTRMPREATWRTGHRAAPVRRLESDARTDAWCTGSSAGCGCQRPAAEDRGNSQ